MVLGSSSGNAISPDCASANGPSSAICQWDDRAQRTSWWTWYGTRDGPARTVIILLLRKLDGCQCVCSGGMIGADGLSG